MGNESRTQAPPGARRFSADAKHRLARVRSLVMAGVDVRAAVATELVRSIRAKALDGPAAAALFERARQVDPSDTELTAIQEAWEEGRTDDTVEYLRAYLHRITVEDVPVADRRMRRAEYG